MAKGLQLERFNTRYGIQYRDKATGTVGRTPVEIHSRLGEKPHAIASALATHNQTTPDFRAANKANEVKLPKIHQYLTRRVVNVEQLPLESLDGNSDLATAIRGHVVKTEVLVNGFLDALETNLHAAVATITRPVEIRLPKPPGQDAHGKSQYARIREQRFDMGPSRLVLSSPTKLDQATGTSSAKGRGASAEVQRRNRNGESYLSAQASTPWGGTAGASFCTISIEASGGGSMEIGGFSYQECTEEHISHVY